MPLTTEAATLRASIARELVRLRARSWEGGPYLAWRDGALITDGDTVLTQEHADRLSALPGAAGAEKVREALLSCD